MKIVLTIWIALFTTGLSFAQPAKDSFLLVKTYSGDIADVAMDNLDNLYIVSSTGQIKKLNAAGDSIGIYNQVRNYGKLYSLDVSNPLKILLFYRDFSTVVILDRYLAGQATVDLKRFSILNASAIGNSYDNRIWIYDEYDGKLKKIDEQGNKLLETPDFRTIFNQPISPQRIINDNGLVYLADTTNGIFVFDNYGTFKKKLPLKNWQTIAVTNNAIVSTQNEVLAVFNTSTQMQTQKKIPFFKPYVRSYITPTKLVNFSTNTVQVYQYRF